MVVTDGTVWYRKVQLTPEQDEALKALARQGEAPGVTLTRAAKILEAVEGIDRDHPLLTRPMPLEPWGLLEVRAALREGRT